MARTVTVAAWKKMPIESWVRLGIPTAIDAMPFDVEKTVTIVSRSHGSEQCEREDGRGNRKP